MVLFRVESGEALKMQRQVTFAGKSNGVSNRGEGLVPCREQELCSLHPALDDVLVRRATEGLFKTAGKVIRTEPTLIPSEQRFRDPERRNARDHSRA